MLECVRDADLLPGRAQGDTGAPVQPVGARLEARAPALPLVELADEHQETVGGGMDVGGELRDLVAEAFEVGAWWGAVEAGVREAGVRLVGVAGAAWLDGWLRAKSIMRRSSEQRCGSGETGPDKLLPLI